MTPNDVSSVVYATETMDTTDIRNIKDTRDIRDTRDTRDTWDTRDTTDTEDTMTRTPETLGKGKACPAKFSTRDARRGGEGVMY